MRFSGLPQRKNIRLKGYDYSQPGAYFLTVCTRNRANLLGGIRAGEMAINRIGQIVEDCWNELPRHYSNVQLDAFVVMPNHVHGIIVLLDDVQESKQVGEGLRPSPTSPTRLTKGRPSLTEIVRAFKTFSARRINEQNHMVGKPFWQRGYYEHIIRNDKSLRRIREYIASNPQQWELDKQNPDRNGCDDIERQIDFAGGRPVSSKMRKA